VTTQPFLIRMKTHTPVLLAAAILALATSPALAHVTLAEPRATAGGSYKAVFRVGHGCSGSPTREFVVEIPAGVRGAKPMAKPGWRATVERAPLAVPYQSHGRTVREDTVRLTWTARTPEDALPSAHYDEFVVVATLPAQAGRLVWPVRQVCDAGRLDWVEVAPAGQPWGSVPAPAPVLEVDAPPAGGHSHVH